MKKTETTKKREKKEKTKGRVLLALHDDVGLSMLAGVCDDLGLKLLKKKVEFWLVNC